ncbi:hypothetical protein TNCV_3445941 [Trichonephila clavipes]|nr:hypothetical protein TNCV_3445941 [Trichonephila clavipes]
MLCVVIHYPVEICLMTSVEFMGGPRAPTSQRCSSECLVYRQCVLKGVEEKSNTTHKALYLVQDQSGDA